MDRPSSAPRRHASEPSATPAPLRAVTDREKLSREVRRIMRDADPVLVAEVLSKPDPLAIAKEWQAQRNDDRGVTYNPENPRKPRTRPGYQAPQTFGASKVAVGSLDAMKFDASQGETHAKATDGTAKAVEDEDDEETENTFHRPGVRTIVRAGSVFGPSEERGEVARVQAALAKLDDEDRVLFRMVFAERLSLAETGRALGLSKGAVQNRLAVLKSKVRRDLEGES